MSSKIYYAIYKNQHFKEVSYYDTQNERWVKEYMWVDTSYKHQYLFVLAENLSEAKQKIDYCINQLNYQDDYRSVLDSEIEECMGFAQVCSSYSSYIPVGIVENK